MALNIKPALKAEANIKTRHFHKSKNQMADVVPHPNSGYYITTTSSSDVCITDNINMQQTNFPPNAVYFPTQILKKEKLPSIFSIHNFQVRQSVTHIDSNGNRVPKIIAKVMIFIISVDPIYLIEVTPNQTRQVNIYSLR